MGLAQVNFKEHGVSHFILMEFVIKNTLLNVWKVSVEFNNNIIKNRKLKKTFKITTKKQNYLCCSLNYLAKALNTFLWHAHFLLYETLAPHNLSPLRMSSLDATSAAARLHCSDTGVSIGLMWMVTTFGDMCVCLFLLQFKEYLHSTLLQNQWPKLHVLSIVARHFVKNYFKRNYVWTLTETRSRFLLFMHIVNFYVIDLKMC